MAEAEEPKDPKTSPLLEEGGANTTAPVDAEPDTEVEEGIDSETDEAVDDIVRKEGDADLKEQDEQAAKPTVMKQGFWEKFKNFQADWWGDPRKKWSTIVAIVVIIAAVFAVPMTRYDILGLFVRARITVQAVDSKTGTPVSGAMVQIADETAETNAEGKAVLTVHTGSKQVQVSKKYYSGTTQKVLVTLSSNSNVYKEKLVALGRQVKVKVVDKVTGKAVESAKISAGGATAKTDKDGMAIVVLPSGATTQQAVVSVVGYNNATVTIDANGNLAKNTLSVTPSGKLYFLSNLSGTIDVVKTNLDGTDRQTVLAGTGNEDPHSTSLLASRDWKYLALLSKRSGDNASLYLIDATNGDKLTTIDQGNADFTPVGWSGDRFVYEVDRSATVQNWQAGQQVLKSFDPTTGHTLQLDQTQASGSGSSQYAGQFYAASQYLIGNTVVYAKGWQSDYLNYANDLAGKSLELDSINSDGTNHKVLKTFAITPTTNYYNLGLNLYEPGSLYIYFYQGSDGNQFYDYENGKVTADTNLTVDTYSNTPYQTYLLSPSGNNTFWADQRDGKNTLFTGDENGDNQKQIASLSGYNTYGWFTDDYLLVSKNSSELYIMPVGGGTPLKITDYYKPPINYNGYGGGYGGL